MISKGTVAVFNTSEDTTDLLRIVLETAGYVVVTAFTNAIRDGKLDLESFIRQHRPEVILYDIAIPYVQNWRLFSNISDAPACQGLGFVLTSTNPKRVYEASDTTLPIYEIIGKPYDLDAIVRAVDAAMERARTGQPQRTEESEDA